MGYHNFRLHVVIRLLLLLALGYGALYVATQTYFWLVSFWLGLGTVVMTVELIRYVEKSERSLTNFLWAISQNDFSHTFATGRRFANPTGPIHRSGRSAGRNSSSHPDRLREAYQRILRVFQQLRDEKETHHQYLQTVVEHVNVALLCYNQQGEIKLMNAAAKALLRKPILKNLHSLDNIDPQLRQAIQQLETGQQALVKTEIEQSLVSLAIRATQFKLHGEKFTLLTLQDIRYELEAQEVESWQKLIRVLTHEIMNSVIPISTLTSVVSEMLVDEHGQLVDLTALDSEEASDLQGSIQTIESRSKGLVNFVKAYKSITQLPTPHFTTVSVRALFQRVHTLLKTVIAGKGIRLDVIMPPPDLIIKADLELVEQSLINLLSNAMDAVSPHPFPTIMVSAGKNSNNQLYIQVKDNGAGIDPEVLSHIFVPFFTTKPNGSGIGLSLSKQIMLLHKGNITVHSKVDEGSTFTLVF